MVTTARCGCTSGTCSCTVTALDTGCIDTTVTGVGSSENPYIVSSVPKVDPAAGNLLTCETTGFRADLSTLDTNCVFLDGTGHPSTPLSATLQIAPATSGCIKCTPSGVQLGIDPAAGNQLSCSSAGLLVPAAGAFTSTDSNCIDFTGAGTPASPLVANLIISPATSGCVKCTATGVEVGIDSAAGNLLTCEPAGLRADLSHVDTNCVFLDGAGTPASPLTATLQISPATSGCITCDTDGLELTFAPLGGISCGPSGITASFPETLIFAVGDETTPITTGVAKVTYRMPFAMTLTSVRASLTTASSSGDPTVDINESGTTILSTKLSIDATEKTSTTAAVASVISDTALADDSEITIDIDAAGTGATGLKVYLIGTRT